MKISQMIEDHQKLHFPNSQNNKKKEKKIMEFIDPQKAKKSKKAKYKNTRKVQADLESVDVPSQQVDIKLNKDGDNQPAYQRMRSERLDGRLFPRNEDEIDMRLRLGMFKLEYPREVIEEDMMDYSREFTFQS